MTPVDRPAVRLRPLVVDDAAVIAAWAVHPELRRRAGWDPGRTLAEVRAHHARLIADPPSDLLRLGVEADGELVGYVDLRGTGPDERELGYLAAAESGGAGASALRRPPRRWPTRSTSSALTC